MDRQTTIDRLRANQAQLKALGVHELSLFGSVARGDAGPLSDVDIAVAFDPTARVSVLGYVKIAQRIEQIVGTRVDVVSEPARKARMQQEIDRDRVRVF